MATVISILTYLALAAALLALVGFLTGRFFQEDGQPDERHYFTTEDGWRLCLSRYLPGQPLEGAPPVVLCPGPGMSGAIFDLMEDVSLARYLRTWGHDCWVLDLRGRGASERPRWWGRRRLSWSFDDFVDFDLPAALETVCRKSGAEQVQWVGFSLGGILPLALRPELSRQRVRSVLGMGATAHFRGHRETLGDWRRRALQVVWSRSVVRLLSLLLGRVTPPPFRNLANADNVDGPVLRRALINAVARLAPAELLQYSRWLQADRMETEDQGRDYRKNLQLQGICVQLMAGPRDPLARAASVEHTLASLENARERQLVMASRSNGLSCNYGHLDLLIGRNVRRDTFPFALAWLDSHADPPPHAEGRPRPHRARIPGVPPVAPAPPSRVQLNTEVLQTHFNSQGDPTPAAPGPLPLVPAPPAGHEIPPAEAPPPPAESPPGLPAAAGAPDPELDWVLDEEPEPPTAEEDDERDLERLTREPGQDA